MTPSQKTAHLKRLSNSTPPQIIRVYGRAVKGLSSKPGGSSPEIDYLLLSRCGQATSVLASMGPCSAITKLYEIGHSWLYRNIVCIGATQSHSGEQLVRGRKGCRNLEICF